MGAYEIESTVSTIFFPNVTDPDDDLKTMETKRRNMIKYVFIIICTLGIIGNGVTILALSKSKKIRNSTTTFIINLGISDLLYCLVTFLNYICPSWSLNSVYCNFYPMTRFCVAGVSSYTVVAITINRYVCVVYSRFYSRLYQSKYLAMMIIVIWASTIFQSLLPVLHLWGRYDLDSKVGFCTVLNLNGKSPNNYFFITSFLFPTLSFAICYPRIFWRVHKASKRLRNVNNPKPPKATSTSPVTLNAANFNIEDRDDACESSNTAISSSTSERQYRRELRVLKVMLAVVLGFIFSYCPLAFIKMFEKEAHLPGWIVLFSYILFNLSNIINPIIYVAMSSEYKEAYKELFYFKMIPLGDSSNSDLIKHPNSGTPFKEKLNIRRYFQRL